MTPERIAAVKRELIIEEVAKALYYGVRAIHDHDDWPEWKHGRAMNAARYSRQLYFLAQAMGYLAGEMPEHGDRCTLAAFGTPIHGNVYGWIGPLTPTVPS